MKIRHVPRPIIRLNFFCPRFSFAFPAPFFVSGAESDCARVFCRRSVHMLLPVSGATNAVLGLTSNAPGALLFGAQQKMEQKDHKAYEWVFFAEN